MIHESIIGASCLVTGYDQATRQLSVVIVNFAWSLTYLEEYRPPQDSYYDEAKVAAKSLRYFLYSDWNEPFVG